MAEKPRLGYWNIRGLVNPIRLLLGYLEVDFDETLYDPGDPESWFSVKETLGLALPNIPYLFDGDVQVTEHTAIMQYLC